MTNPLEITPSCGCVYCDLEVEHPDEYCRLRGSAGVSFDDWLAEENSTDEVNQRAAGALRRALVDGQVSADLRSAEEYIVHVRDLVGADVMRQRLYDDLIAVQCWLASRHTQFGYLVLERHYSSAPDEIAYVMVHGPDDRDQRRAIRAGAETAFRALGWRISPEPGRDVYDVHVRFRDLSAHQRLAAVARVERALSDED